VRYFKQKFIIAAVCALLIPPAASWAIGNVIIVPSGTVIPVRMIDSVSTDRNVAGQVVRGSLQDPVRVANRIAVPRGATAYMRLVEVESAGHIKGRNELALQLERIQFGNHTYPVHSQTLAFRGRSQGKRTAKDAGIGAAIGGGVGALFGGGKGLGIGAGLGAGAGLAHRALKEPGEIRIGSESLLQFRLAAPLHVQE